MNTIKLKLFLIALISVFAVLSCRYSPGGENMVEIEEPGEAPDVNVDLNFASDTLYLNRPSTVRFSISGKNKVNWAQMFIGGVHIGTIYSATGGFDISQSFGFYQDGTYILKIEFFTSTGTGSMADMLQSEGFVYSNSWVLVIRNGSYLSSDITKITDRNGKLKLEWNAYKGIDFKSYIVRKSHWINQTFDTVAVITDQNQTWTYDPSFVGEKAQYQIATVVNGQYSSYNGKTADFQGELPQIYSEYKGKGVYRIYWSKSKYAENISKYNLYKEKTYFNDLELLKSAAPSDTSFLYQVNSFGLDEKLVLNLVPNQVPNYFKNYNWFYDFCVRSGYLGDKLHAMWLCRPDQYGGKFYYTAKDSKYGYKLYVYDTQIHRSDSVQMQSEIHVLDVSPGSKWVVGHSQLTGRIFAINTESPRQVNYIDSKDIFGYTSGNMLVVVSDNGILVAENDLKTCLYDLNKRQLIWSVDHTPYISSIRVSADGNYLLRGNTLFKINSLGIQEVKTFSENPEGFTYPNNQVIFKSLNKVEFVDCASLETVKTIEVAGWLKNIDFRRGHLLAFDNENLSIYDLNTGTFLLKMSSDYSNWTMSLVNGNLFSVNGVTININNDLR